MFAPLTAAGFGLAIFSLARTIFEVMWKRRGVAHKEIEIDRRIGFARRAALALRSIEMPLDSRTKADATACAACRLGKEHHHVVD
jgi:hypothetical protein